MWKDNMSAEEEDKLILDELGITEDDSTTNNNEEDVEDDSTEPSDSEEETEEESIDSEEEEAEEADESEEEEEETEEEAEEEQTWKKPKNGFAKLLAKKNEAKKEAEQANKDKAQAESQVQELQAKLDQMEEDGTFWDEDYVNTLVEKKIAERDEVNDFFDDFSELRHHKKDIIKSMQGNNYSLDVATKLYLAENEPALLLSPQQKAKQKAAMYKTPWRTNKKILSWEDDFSDEEFAEKVKKGEITL